MKREHIYLASEIDRAETWAYADRLERRTPEQASRLRKIVAMAEAPNADWRVRLWLQCAWGDNDPLPDEIAERGAEERRKRVSPLLGSPGVSAAMTERREAIRRHIAENGPTCTADLAGALAVTMSTIANAIRCTMFERRGGRIWNANENQTQE